MNTKKKFDLFIAFIFISIFIAILSEYFNLSQTSIENFVLINHTLSAFIYTFLFIALATFSFSVSVMTSLGAVFFSIPEIIIYAMIGIMGSSIIDFYIARKLGRGYVRNYIEKRGGKLEKFDEIIEKDTFKTTMILSAIFFVPPTIPNLLGGIMKINLKNYSIATFLGNIPNTIFTVLLINGFLYSNTLQIYTSIIALVMITVISLYFYKGEIRDIIKLSFPLASKILPTKATKN